VFGPSRFGGIVSRRGYRFFRTGAGWQVLVRPCGPQHLPTSATVSSWLRRLRLHALTWHHAELTYAVAAREAAFAALPKTYNIIHATLAAAVCSPRALQVRRSDLDLAPMNPLSRGDEHYEANLAVDGTLNGRCARRGSRMHA